jgi:hypothetical protein
MSLSLRNWDIGGLSTFVGHAPVDLDLSVETFFVLLKGTPTMMGSFKPDEPLLLLLLSGLDSLRSLSLRGFLFAVDALQELLLALTRTLRTLRLADCHCLDTYYTFFAFAKQHVAVALTLTGVEVYDLRFGLDYQPPLDAELARREMREYREMRYRQSVWSIETLSRKQSLAGRDMAWGWPFERQELEAAMLDGCVNKIARRFWPPPRRGQRWEIPVTYGLRQEQYSFHGSQVFAKPTSSCPPKSCSASKNVAWQCTTQFLRQSISYKHTLHIRGSINNHIYLQTATLAFFLVSLFCIHQTAHVIPACATNMTEAKMKPLWNLGASIAGKTR